MAIPTLSKMVVRCPACGDIGYHDLSLFHFSGSNSVKLECSCGAFVASLATKDKKHYWVQVECGFCEERHLYYYRWKDLWNKDVLTLTCEESGLDISYIGPKNDVEKVVEKEDQSLAEMAEDLGFGQYFSNPEIMYGVLDYLYQLAENGNLFCQCGNYDVEIEIFPDRLELKCDYCHYTGTIMAQNERDLEAVRKLSEIELTSAGFKCLEGKARPRRHFKK